MPKCPFDFGDHCSKFCSGEGVATFGQNETGGEEARGLGAGLREGRRSRCVPLVVFIPEGGQANGVEKQLAHG